MKKIHTPMKRIIGNHEIRSDMYQGFWSTGRTLILTFLSRSSLTKSCDSTTYVRNSPPSFSFPVTRLPRIVTD